MVDINNYHKYYFIKDNNTYFINSINFRSNYGLYNISEIPSHYNYELYANTFAYMLKQLRDNNYTAILKEDYDKMENCVKFSYTEQNFSNSILKAIKDSPETTHYCKNLCKSILSKI